MSVSKQIKDLKEGTTFKYNGVEFRRHEAADFNGDNDYYWVTRAGGGGYNHVFYGYETVEVDGQQFDAGRIYHVARCGTDVPPAIWFCHRTRFMLGGLQFTSITGVTKTEEQFRNWLDENDFVAS